VRQRGFCKLVLEPLHPVCDVHELAGEAFQEVLEVLLGEREDVGRAAAGLQPGMICW